jgi:hypothetical protein
MRRRIAAIVALALSVSVAGAIPAAAAANFPTTIPLPDGWQPEGITAGPGTTVFVGSLRDGSIWKGDVRTGEGDPFIPGDGATKPSVGVEYEKGADRLWVAGGPSGEVRVYDATTGAHLRTWTFSPAGFINDLVVTEDAVYATNSFAPYLAVVPLGPGGALPPSSGAEMLPLTGDLVFGAGFNTNGIVAARGWLITVHSGEGNLYRVDPETGDTTLVRGVSGVFGDGLELRGSTLFVVERDPNVAPTVSAYALGPQLDVAVHLRDAGSAGFDVPTTVAFQAGRLWVVNARFGTPPGPDVDYWITQVPAN